MQTPIQLLESELKNIKDEIKGYEGAENLDEETQNFALKKLYRRENMFKVALIVLLNNKAEEDRQMDLINGIKVA